MKPLLALALLALLSIDTPTVTPDPENVTASRIIGTWQKHADLINRLTPKLHWGPDILTFELDPQITARIPQQHHKYLSAQPIYLAGNAHFDAKTYPYVLTTSHGNPHVVYFNPRDGNPLGDTESMNVFVARADDPLNDLLFVGGDFNNQPFNVYERVKPK